MRKSSSALSSSSLFVPLILLFVLLAISLFIVSNLSEFQDLFLYSRTARLLHESAGLHCDQQHRSGESRARTRSTSTNGSMCPSYFRHIREDLAPWSSPPGITRDRHRWPGAMRITILGGKLYARAYGDCPQSRGVFSLWGLLLLLDRYGDRVPDVEFVLNCKDRPVLPRSSSAPAPVFSYCSDSRSADIPFPDYSFWGWPEVNIRPWEEESKDIFQGSAEFEWARRQPVAFWKGNLRMGKLRKLLVGCSSTNSATLIYDQNWIAEANVGYENSKLRNQCDHRYNIYAEGAAWSASLKYKMACGSTMLYLDSEYHEFFTKGLIPNLHFVPVSSAPDKMCRETENAVAWGNLHIREAEEIGRNGQAFVREQVSMDRVYDYMFHLLTEYAKLQKFVPGVPKGARLICKRAIEHIAITSGKQRYLQTPKRVEDSGPCAM